MSNEGGLDALIDSISRETGLLPREDWTNNVSRTLGILAEQRETTAETLIRDASTWSVLMPELCNAVTVRETFFFRHREHFDFLVGEIEKHSAAVLSTPIIWSAGCATGEEPYSIAIAIHSRLGMDTLSRVRIVASDISADAIRKARAGVYGAWAFRDTPAWLSHGYFHRAGSTGAKLIDIVQRAVHFEVVNILHQAAALPKASVDIIFFRNVAIYLSPTVLAEVYREFHRILKPRGLLIVAPGDPRPSTVYFIDEGHESTSVYRSRSVDEKLETVAEWPRRMGSSHESSCRLPAISTVQTKLVIGSKPPKPPPSMNTLAEHVMTEAQALRAADMGDRTAINAIVTNLFARASTTPTAYLIRAHVSLDSGQPEAAVEDLRRVLFLRPEHRLARYWYVLALQAGGQLARAVAQGRELETILAKLAKNTLLEDGETTAGQLLEAIRFVKEGF